MERQKIFWVVLSVSVFVVVVLVVGAFLLRPRPASSAEAPVTVSPLSDQGTQVYEYQVPAGTPGASGATGGQTGAASSSGTTGTPGNTETLHFYIGEGGDAGSKPPASTVSPAASSASTGQTGASQAPSVQSLAAAARAAQAAAVPRATPAPRTTPAAPVAKPPVRTAQYWIQTGSYRSQTKAEDLARLLDDKGLAGRVFSYDAQGATWFRVRVGPYTSKGEADKFLAEVKKLQGLETSYISQVGPAKPPVIN